MLGYQESAVPLVNSVFHPSDFSMESAHAFAHALGIALVRKTELTIMHAIRNAKDEDWTRFPPIRETLERWGILEPGSPRSAILDELSLRVKKVNVLGKSPAAAILSYLEKKPTDLIVLATESREGMPRWLKKSVAEEVARKSKTKTLFVPAGTRGLVSLANGSMVIERLLVPVDRTPDPRPSIVYAGRAAAASTVKPAEVTFLHVGEPGGMPDFDPPETEGVVFKKIERPGEPVEQILEAAKEFDASAILMATEGERGIFGGIRGGVSDKIVRNAPCPVMTIP